MKNYSKLAKIDKLVRKFEIDLNKLLDVLIESPDLDNIFQESKELPGYKKLSKWRGKSLKKF